MKNIQDGQVSPSPDYPQIVHKVTGNCNEKVQNKNTFDNTKLAYNFNTTVTQINTGIRATTKSTSATQFCLFALTDLTNYVGKTVRMKADFISSASNVGNYKIGLCNSDGSERTTLSAASVTTGTTISFVIPAIEDEKKYLGVWLYSNNNGTAVAGNYVDYTNVIVTIDDENLDYIAHAEQNAPLTLEDIKLYDGDKIQISYVNKAGYKKVTGANVIKKCNEYTFDGSIAGDYTFKDDNTNTISVNLYPNQIDQGILKGTNDIPIYCSDFLYVNDLSDTEHLYVTAATPITGGWKGNTRIYLNKTRLTGYSSSLTNAQKLNLFKTYLTQNPITIAYKSVQSTTTPITDTTLLSQLETLINLKTYKEVTHIDATGADLAPVLEFNYYKDMTTIFDNLEARVELLEN